MRPINLIPEDERRGPGVKRKGGPLAYILIGALLVLLAGVTLMVSTSNEISSTKAEITEIEAENAAAEEQAAKLAAYTELADVRAQRVGTVQSLAESRFDWERVFRELSLILPGDVTLNCLSGTVKAEVSVNGSCGIALRGGAAGPAIEIDGCSHGQDGVAGFVASLRDMDGVTRVAMQYSKLGEATTSETATDSASATTDATCPKGEEIAEFQIAVTFDAAPVPSVGGESEVAPVTTEESAAPAEEEVATEE